MITCTACAVCFRLRNDQLVNHARLPEQVPNVTLYLGVNVWTLTGRCRLHGPIIDWFRFETLNMAALPQIIASTR